MANYIDTRMTSRIELARATTEIFASDFSDLSRKKSDSMAEHGRKAARFI